jgi:hypothetical protein
MVSLGYVLDAGTGYCSPGILQQPPPMPLQHVYLDPPLNHSLPHQNPFLLAFRYPLNHS